MKKLLTILPLLFIYSCATGSRDSARVLNSDKDLLAVESFQRLSSNALEQLSSQSEYSGVVKCYQGKIDKGLEILRSQLNTRRKDPSYWNSMSVCYIRKAEFAKAQFYLETGLSLVSNKDQATLGTMKNNMALIFMKLGHIQKAFDLFGEAIQLGNQSARYNRLHLALQEEWFDVFEKDYSYLSRRSPSDPDLLFTRALKHIYDDEIDKALGILTKLPEREEVKTYKAFCLYLLDNPQDAVDVLHQVAFFDSREVKELNLELRKAAKKAEELKKEKLRQIELRKVASEEKSKPKK
ncbi:MAG: hypothetical protein COW00_13295 [Bdellovibrio sp. CG12_big_fil_rev_8_21_14_0_65_39_13]|nr:MAG: hypothetical protein COW78_11345 [Bdellovibrio sp. CG22_combo_CG10-13_8_21_14_all_39_27]PIQ58905.1 MAG: hypothetical protein COW00_13295 [Bdellovibrio sp. CG12_big_fil_rev_8_21_14_0_65_39_13]PIR35996.1 MAG: hypothetical protein COV37_05670 [Bdellovibrio sp. CG11_big_fil_rev_8_21_14_0_20_39_38]PJB53433.1 MAG: hypothetical protein CO099_07135 [Bdellovibrio sp. CG_4_9_14_3_um_filter_39_7]